LTLHKLHSKIHVRICILRIDEVNNAAKDHWRDTVCRDPHDDKFLEVAVTGKADVIVSGDNDLLTMTAYADIPIFSVNQFLTMLETPSAR